MGVKALTDLGSAHNVILAVTRASRPGKLPARVGILQDGRLFVTAAPNERILLRIAKRV